MVIGPLAGLLGLIAVEQPAQARHRTEVIWSDVSFPDDALQATRERQLRSVLRRESRREDWGHSQSSVVEASLKIVEFAVEKRPDVVRVTCTAVGKIKNGPAARTHFSFGGHPNKQAALERTMLTLVGRGIVTRLAAISRGRASSPRSGAPRRSE